MGSFLAPKHIGNQFFMAASDYPIRGNSVDSLIQANVSFGAGVPCLGVYLPWYSYSGDIIKIPFFLDYYGGPIVKMAVPFFSLGET